MSEFLCPTKKTTFTAQEAYEAWLQVAPSIEGGKWDAATSSIVIGQFMFETADGSCCYNYNVGNMKPRREGGKALSSYFMYPSKVTEYIDGKLVAFYAPDPQTWFSSFGSLREGIEAYVERVQRLWPEALPAAAKGDLKGFAKGLKRFGRGGMDYFTDTIEHYTKGVSERWVKVYRTLNPTEPLHTLHPDAEGPSVGALRVHLFFAGCGTDKGSDLQPSEFFRYDAQLQEAVKKFQTKNGLKPDAIVGPSTWCTLILQTRKAPV